MAIIQVGHDKRLLIVIKGNLGTRARSLQTGFMAILVF